MSALLLGLWIVALLLPFACRRRPAVVVAVLPIVLLVENGRQEPGPAPDQVTADAWLRRQLEGLGT